MGATMLVSLLAFSGQVGMYRSLRTDFDPSQLRPLAMSLLLMPSVLFWTSGFLKEALAVAGLGWLVAGMHRIVRGSWINGSLIALLAGLWIGLFKPYVLFAAVVAMGVWFYWTRATADKRTVRIRPGYLILGGALAVAGVVFLGQLFPQYSLDTLGEETARLQRGGTDYAGRFQLLHR